MPETTRASGGYAHPWQRGLLAAVGVAMPVAALADERRPSQALHELVVSAHRSIAISSRAQVSKRADRVRVRTSKIAVTTANNTTPSTSTSTAISC